MPYAIVLIKANWASVTIIIKTLLKTTLVSQVIVFRLLYCLFLPRTSESRLTSLLSWSPVLYIVNANTIEVSAQIGQIYAVPVA